MASEEIYPFWSRKRPKASHVWEYFGFRKNEGGELIKTMTYCRLCKRGIIYRGSTSNMMNHLHTAHPEQKYKKTEESPSNDGFEFGEASTSRKTILPPRHKRNPINEFTIDGGFSEETYPYWGKDKPRASAVWRYFGFKKDCTGSLITNRTFCMLCTHHLNYQGNTTNMMLHLNRVHPELDVPKRQITAPILSNLPDFTKSSPRPVEFTEDSSDNFTSSAPQLNIQCKVEPVEPEPAQALPVNTSFAGHYSNKTPSIVSIKGDYREKPKHKDKYSHLSSALCTFIASDMLPLSVIEGRAFQAMLAQFQPNYTVLAMDSYKSQLNTVHFEAYTKLKQELTGIQSSSFTAEVWSGLKSSQYFITIALHFVSPFWVHRHVILKTEPLVSPQASSICHTLEKVFYEWGLTDTTLIGVIDANQNTQEALQDLEKDALTCFGDVMNHAVQKSMQLPNISEAVERGHELCQYMTANQLSLGQAKQELFPDNSLPQFDSNSSYWFDIYNTLQWALQHEATLRNLCAADLHSTSITIKDGDWAVLHELIDTLQPLYQVTLSLCTEGNPTASSILPILNQLKVATAPIKGDSENVQAIKKVITDMTEVKSQYEEESSRDILKLATLLDPRFKNLWFLSEEEKHAAFQHLKATAIEFAINQDNDVVCLEEQNNMEPNDIKAEMEDAFALGKVSQEGQVQNKGLAALFGATGTSRPLSKPKTRLEKEVLRFQDEERMNMDGDPFQWWSEREVAYPVLSQLARQYLSLPACSQPPKVMFTQAGLQRQMKLAAIPNEDLDRSVFLHAYYNNGIM